jgi:energy-coupling factor transporter transmembrane protein EcfT
MPHRPLPSVSIVLACVAAGPVFMVSTALAALYLQLPKPLHVPIDIAGAFVMMLIPSVVIGFILSFLPNWGGSRLLFYIGELFPAARPWPVWLGGGALLGAIIVGAVGAFSQPAAAFGLVFTSASCAAICRHSAAWD